MVKNILLTHDLTIFELINYFNYNTSLLVLEYNNLICNKKNWNKIFIKNNDKIEIVTIVGGG
jgi:sulfur carrier protein